MSQKRSGTKRAGLLPLHGKLERACLQGGFRRRLLSGPGFASV
jgi:hypothetical protein